MKMCSLLARSRSHLLLTRSFSTLNASENAAPLVVVEKLEKYAIVRLNRAPVNSLNTQLLKALNKTIKDLEGDKSVKGMILASTNPKIFSAGLDILEMYQPKPANLRTFWTTLQDVYLNLYTSRLATVAAIEGHSPAGGCLLAMCCDWRVMATGKPMIGLNETQLGIVAPPWFKDTFVNTIGHREAEKMLGLGLQVDASKAKSIGLVDEAVPVEEVFPRAEAAMTRWLMIPDAARVKTKLLLRQETADRLRNNKETDCQLFEDVILTDKTQRSLGGYLDALKKKN